MSIELPDGVVINFNNSNIKNMIAKIPEGGSAYIGRSEDCYIRVKPECQAVSREHILIYRKNGQIYIQDISRNGTKIYQN